MLPNVGFVFACAFLWSCNVQSIFAHVVQTYVSYHLVLTCGAMKFPFSWIKL
jgi:hypothetical protein